MANSCRKLKIDKKGAAKRQIESAIHLWFNRGDPVSIHTLAAAASEILHVIGKDKGLMSMEAFLRTQPKAYQHRMRYPQNFFKHGFSDLKATLNYFPIHGELYLFEAATSYGCLFGATSLMLCFSCRYVTEYRTRYPSWSGRLREAGMSPKRILALSRTEFLDDFLPLFQRKRDRPVVKG